MKILKIIYYNFLVFLALIILIEVFFGYWFKDENFGIYMRKERKINWQTSSNFNGKEYNFSYKRNYWGFRGEDFDPKNVQVIFEGGSTGNQRFTPQKLTIVGSINEKFRLSNVNINIYNASTDGKSVDGYINDFNFWFSKIPIPLFFLICPHLSPVRHFCILFQGYILGRCKSYGSSQQSERSTLLDSGLPDHTHRFPQTNQVRSCLATTHQGKRIIVPGLLRKQDEVCSSS